MKRADATRASAAHPNILKRLLVHVAAFNLGLVMRKMLGCTSAGRWPSGWRWCRPRALSGGSDSGTPENIVGIDHVTRRAIAATLEDLISERTSMKRAALRFLEASYHETASRVFWCCLASSMILIALSV